MANKRPFMLVNHLFVYNEDHYTFRFEPNYWRFGRWDDFYDGPIPYFSLGPFHFYRYWVPNRKINHE